MKCKRICIPLFIYFLRYSPGATFKPFAKLLGWLGELLRITTYSRVLRNSSDWSKRLLNMDENFNSLENDIKGSISLPSFKNNLFNHFCASY